MAIVPIVNCCRAAPEHILLSRQTSCGSGPIPVCQSACAENLSPAQRSLWLQTHQAGMRNEGVLLSGKTVRKLMKELGISSLIRVKKYRSYKGEQGRICDNLLKRQFDAERPNEKWVTDVTEFKVNGKKLYLSPIMDLYNGEIIAYNLATRPLSSMVQTMLTDALKQLPKDEHPILHNDQGWQYQMSRWQRWLKDSGIVQSMSRRGNCLDNAVIESFFGTLKSECYYLNEYKNVDDLKRGIFGYIDYYNQLRIKEKLGGLSPVQYRLNQAA